VDLIGFLAQRRQHDDGDQRALPDTTDVSNPSMRGIITSRMTKSTFCVLKIARASRPFRSDTHVEVTHFQIAADKIPQGFFIITTRTVTLFIILQ